MSTHRAGHDTRCERSATKASRCQCDCGGNLHGIQRREAAQHALAMAHNHGYITDDELADALQHLRTKAEVTMTGRGLIIQADAPGLALPDASVEVTR